MSEKIKLELDPKVPTLDLGALPTVSPVSAPLDTVTLKEELAQPETAAHYMEDVNLTEEEQKMVDDFAEQIDLSNTNVVLQYGAASQKKIADFSDSALEGVRTKDLGEVGDAIASLVAELKGFDVSTEDKGGILGWFKKKGNKLTQLKARYDSADKNVDKISGVLMDHQNQLTTDIVMMDKMYDSNLVYFKELTMYILAGKKALEKAQSTTLVELQNKAKESGLTEDAQAANDYAALCDRFDKKLYDLELTRTISMQMAPQIRLIQNSDTLMVEKIQSTLSNTIPLWKNQMVLAMGMIHSEEAMKAQKEVNDLTNELIQKNAEKLHQGSVEIAEESERGIIDIETVAHANEELIASLDEVIKIQEEGRMKRRVAEDQLGQVEAQLKQKLLDIRNAELKSTDDSIQ
ncbi:MAG: toxic anion resistance protein [Lachnospiraceae bacterium]|nr:toxic anion resistance protein [Lachnospiraceae bacterium]MDO4734453.1 toxic anion resistance protein [Lachnospiraceae bacterium]